MKKLAGVAVAAAAVAGLSYFTLKSYAAAATAKNTLVISTDPTVGDFGPFTPGTRTAGIQEAIKEAPTGELSILDGVYELLDGLTTYPSGSASINLTGQSLNGTVIRQAANANNGVLFSTENNDVLQSKRYLSSLHLSNMTWDFNVSNQATAPKQFLYGAAPGTKYASSGGDPGYGLGSILNLFDADITLLENLRVMNAGCYGMNLGFHFADGAMPNQRIFGDSLYGQGNYCSYFLTSAANNAPKIGYLNSLTALDDTNGSLYLDDGQGWNVDGIKIASRVAANHAPAILFYAGTRERITGIDIDLTGSMGAGAGIQISGQQNALPVGDSYFDIKRIVGVPPGYYPVNISGAGQQVSPIIINTQAAVSSSFININPGAPTVYVTTVPA